MMNEEDKKYIEEDQVNQLCKKGYRVLAFGYKDMSPEQFEEANSTGIKLESLETHLNFVTIIALQDQVRPDIKKIVQFISGETGE